MLYEVITEFCRRKTIGSKKRFIFLKVEATVIVELDHILNGILNLAGTDDNTHVICTLAQQTVANQLIDIV